MRWGSGPGAGDLPELWSTGARCLLKSSEVMSAMLTYLTPIVSAGKRFYGLRRQTLAQIPAQILAQTLSQIRAQMLSQIRARSGPDPGPDPGGAASAVAREMGKRAEL